MNNHFTANHPHTDDRVIIKAGKDARKASNFLLILLLSAGLTAASHAAVSPDGTEYQIADPLPGDQAHADLALNPNGGYLVWDDNIGDGSGLSVNMRHVTPALSGELNVIALATKTAGHQERPHVVLLNGGGAAFTWQSGPDSQQRIFTRVISPDNVFTGPETAVSGRIDLNQSQASLAALPSGGYVVTWAADGGDDSMLGVFGCVFNAAGQRISREFQVNQFTQFNQRNPAVAALPGGGFVVTWISEGNRNEASADLYARVFNSSAAAVGDEFRVNDSDRICSSPSIAITTAGNFTIAWCESLQDLNVEAWITPVNNSAGWDVYASGFSADAVRLTGPTRINHRVEGHQRNPSIAAAGRAFLVVWSSYGQDGDKDGIIGRSLNGTGLPDGDEFIVNTTRFGNQVYPVVRGNDDGRFVVCWSTFTGLTTEVDLKAQRFGVLDQALELPQPGAPYVSALSQNRLSITWPSVDGYDVRNYELYIDGASTPVVVTGQVYLLTGLPVGSTHRVEIAYRLQDGQLSPRSPQATGRTWGEDANFDGIPDDWQTQHFGLSPVQWPSPEADSDGDGVSNRLEFMAGTNPKDRLSVLRTTFSLTPQGWRLEWNSVPGLIYQVQQTSDFSTWTDIGGLRFAPGTTDAVTVPLGNSVGYYRVTRIR